MAKQLQTSHSIMDLVSRLTAAVAGGYALANVVPVGLWALLGPARSEASLAALLTSFVVYTAAILWVFHAQSHWRAWLGLILPGLGFGFLAWLLLA